MSRTNATAHRNGETSGRRPGNPKPGASAEVDQPLRQSGIRVVGEVPWGAHICIFYETKDDLLDTAAAYFKTGLATNSVFGRSRSRLPRPMPRPRCAASSPT